MNRALSFTWVFTFHCICGESASAVVVSPMIPVSSATYDAGSYRVGGGLGAEDRPGIRGSETAGVGCLGAASDLSIGELIYAPHWRKAAP